MTSPDDGMAALGMLSHAVLDREAFAQLDAEEHIRFVDADSGAGGIPTYKMYTDHQWVVTPREIYAALTTHAGADDSEQTMMRLLGPEVMPLWKRWLAYLSLAASNGGFCVEGGWRLDPMRTESATSMSEASR